MSSEVSTLRLYLLRALYLLNFVFLGFDVWSAIVTHTGTWDPLRGVAFSFWAALSLLCGLGVRYPLRMLPLLLLQLLYKCIWVVAVALPMWPTLRSAAITKSMLIPIPMLLIVIPWTYVFATFVKSRGDRWKALPSAVELPRVQGAAR